MTLADLDEWITGPYKEKLKVWARQDAQNNQFPQEAFEALMERDFYRCFFEDSASLLEKRHYFAQMVRIIAQEHPSLALIVSFQMVFGLYALGVVASQEQRKKWLRSFIEGKVFVAAAWNEDVSGYRTELIQTKLVKQGANYQLKGSKEFVSNARLADLFFVVSVLEQEYEDEPCLVILDKNRIEVIESKTSKIKGLSSISLDSLEFSQVTVTESDFLGEKIANKDQLKELLQFFEYTVSAVSLGLGESLWKKVLNYVRKPRRFGTSLIEVPQIQLDVAALYSELKVSQVYFDNLISNLNDCPADSAVLKLSTSKLVRNLSQKVVKIIPQMNLDKQEDIKRLVEDCAQLEKVGGSIQTQAHFLAQMWK